jgi:pilus assembly protein CpaC
MSFGIIDGGSSFFGFLEALREDNLAKILAEPTLTTVSGRPAFFNSGGEFPVLVPQALGTNSIEYKKYGTQIDFVPIVLGNGRIRLEVRPRVSELDRTQSNGTGAPGLKVREVETGVEMQAGQTLALAGLVQYRSEGQFRGLPWVSEVPYLGAAFRRVNHEMNEVELLILVTPELVDPLDAHQVANCGPGMSTTDPSDFELFWKGSLEVPACCPSCQGAGCGQCGGGGGGPRGADPQGAPQGGAAIDGLPPGAVMIQQQDEVRTGPQGTPASYRSTTVARNGPQGRAAPSGPSSTTGSVQPAFIGPIGYDVVK